MTILAIFIQLEYAKKEKLEVEKKEKIAIKNKELKCQIEQINDFLFNEYIFKLYDVDIHYNYLKKKVLSDSRFEILKDPIEKTENFISLEYGDSVKSTFCTITIEEGNYFHFLISLKSILGSNSLKKSMIFKVEKLETFIGQFEIMIILMFKLLEHAADEELLYIKTTLMKYGEVINLLDQHLLMDKVTINQYLELKFFPIENLFDVDPQKNISKKIKEIVVKELNNLNIKFKIQDIRKINYEFQEKIPILVVETKETIYKRIPKKIGFSYSIDSSVWEKKIK